MTGDPKPNDAEPRGGKPDRTVGLTEFTQRRKQESRRQLLAAALELFCSKGYYTVSVDDIASSAGVSRMTFYRHFKSRAHILVEIFDQNRKAAMPRLIQIRNQDFRDPVVVRAWIASHFSANRAQWQLLRAFAQATKIDTEFLEGAQKMIFEMIEELGTTIPAFAIDQHGGPENRKRWLEGWLVLYDIFDQSNQAALNMGMAGDPLMLDVLTTRFLDFVERYPLPSPS